MAKKGLGKGLSALLGDDRPVIDVPTIEEGGVAADPRGRRMLPIAFLERNVNQPRHRFDESALEELTKSVREKGVLQPILVRPLGPDRFQIVAGERRWRAAQKAGIHEVPVLVRELDDNEVLQLAIIENVQREDLSAIEEAMGFKQLMDEFGHTQETVSEIVGKSRSHVANLIRLLSLPEKVQSMVDEGQLSMGHARALIGADDALSLAKRIASEGLSVRQTEEIARSGKGKSKRVPRPGGMSKRSSNQKDADTIALERTLSATLGMKVSIEHQDEEGDVIIHYSSLEELDDLCAKLGVNDL